MAMETRTKDADGGHPSARWAVCRRYFSLALLATALFCALVGSWQAYAPMDLPLWRLVSAMAYSLMKLFTLSPAVDPEDASLLYTIAIWLCPLCTAHAIYRLAESAIRHQLGQFMLLFRPYTLVYGIHPDSVDLAKDLQKREDKHLRRKVVLLSDEPLPSEKRLELERGGFTVLSARLSGEANDRILQDDLRRLHLSRCKEIILYHPDQAANFTAYVNLLKHYQNHQTKESIPCAVFCRDTVIARLLQKEWEQRGRNLLDLKLFHIADLAARQLFKDKDQPNLLWKGCIDGPKRVRQCHLLLVGLGTWGERVLYQSILRGQFSPENKLKVTVLDREAMRRENELKGRYPYIEKTCELAFQEMDLWGGDAREKLSALCQTVTCAVVCIEDPTTALWAVDRLTETLGENVPIAVRMDQGGAVAQYLEQPGKDTNIMIFGEREKLFTRQVVLDETLDAEAKDFNDRYQKLSGGAVVDWSALSWDKRASCRAQAAFQTTVEQLADLPAVRQEIAAWKKRQKEQESDDQDGEALLRCLENRYPELLRLARLEHARWCNFMYLQGYRFGEERDEEHKTHPCLVDTLEDLPKEQKNTVRYDLIPAMMAFSPSKSESDMPDVRAAKSADPLAGQTA